MTRSSKRFWHTLTLGVLAMALSACGPKPTVRGDAAFRPQLMGRARLLVLPLAVSDYLGDERTGIVLNEGTIASSGAALCESLRQQEEGPEILCFNESSAEAQSQIREVLLRFSKDETIPDELIQRIQRSTKSGFMLLFRPESASASQIHSVGGNQAPLASPSDAAVYGAATASANLTATLLASAMSSDDTASSSMGQIRKTRGYSVSAALLDLSTGKIVRVGNHAASDSKTGGEAPPAAPVLADAMSELADVLLHKESVAAFGVDVQQQDQQQPSASNRKQYAAADSEVAPPGIGSESATSPSPAGETAPEEERRAPASTESPSNASEGAEGSPSGGVLPSSESPEAEPSTPPTNDAAPGVSGVERE